MSGKLLQTKPASPTDGAPVFRRQVFYSLVSIGALSLMPGCGRRADEMPPLGTVGKAALLASLSGSRSGLGEVMASAAGLGGDVTSGVGEISLLDSGDSLETATAAAFQAIELGAKMIVGPLFADQARAVANAVGRTVPVLTLSNDDSIAGDNLHVFGITPMQSARAILGIAAVRGLTRVVVVVPPGEFGQRHISAFGAVASTLGISVGPPVITETEASLLDQIQLASGNTLPDAVYLPVVSQALERQASDLASLNLQILGSDQWSSIAPETIPGLRGAWFAAPDPLNFQGFQQAFEGRFDAEAGVIGALTYDAVELARLLGRLGQQENEGLRREAGFEGALGPYRFLPSGLCERRLAVLSVLQGGITQIASA